MGRLVHATCHKIYKSDVKHRYSLGCLDQYPCNVLRLWNRQDCEPVWVYKYMQRMETVKESGPWSSLGTLVVMWLFCISISGETWKFDFLKVKFDLEGQGQCPQNDRDLNQVILHIWSKFGDPSLNGWWVMVQTTSKWGKFRLSS